MGVVFRMHNVMTNNYVFINNMLFITWLITFQLLELKSCVPMERCRLVRYDEYMETLDQSFDEPEVQSLCVYSVVLLICCLGNHVWASCGWSQVILFI